MACPPPRFSAPPRSTTRVQLRERVFELEGQLASVRARAEGELPAEVSRAAAEALAAGKRAEAAEADAADARERLAQLQVRQEGGGSLPPLPYESAAPATATAPAACLLLHRGASHPLGRSTSSSTAATPSQRTAPSPWQRTSEGRGGRHPGVDRGGEGRTAVAYLRDR